MDSNSGQLSYKKTKSKKNKLKDKEDNLKMTCKQMKLKLQYNSSNGYNNNNEIYVIKQWISKLLNEWKFLTMIYGKKQTKRDALCIQWMPTYSADQCMQQSLRIT